MLTLASHVRSAITAVSLLTFGGGIASAEDRIGIDLRSASSNIVAVGEVIEVEVYIVKEPAGGSASGGLGEAMSAMDLYFRWNPLDLRLVGINAAANAPNMNSYFPTPSQDFSGTNEATPPADGTALYLAQAFLGTRVDATLAGTRVTSFRFQVLREFEATEVNPIVSVTMPNSTTQRFTRVMDAGGPGIVSTGTLSGVTISPGSQSDCVADLDGDGLIEGPDLSFLLAAWETVNSPANFIRTAESPGVDGADLAVLLAAWGVCPN